MSNRKSFQELEFKDAFMFAATMEDEETCRAVLERVLGFPIKKVVVHAEHTILYNPNQRGVRLDVYADDQENTIYNVEMQTTDKHNIPKRSRFHQGQMDVDFLEPRMDFNKLPKSLVIFICTFDPCGRGRYRYTFYERCEEDGELLGDDTCKVFLNTKGKNPEEVPKELVQFLKYVDDPKAYPENTTDALIQRLREQIVQVKHNRRAEDRYMLFEELLKDEREAGVAEGVELGQERTLRLIRLMIEKGLESNIPRLEKEPEFYKEMLKKYKIE